MVSRSSMVSAFAISSQQPVPLGFQGFFPALRVCIGEGDVFGRLPRGDDIGDFCNLGGEGGKLIGRNPDDQLRSRRLPEIPVAASVVGLLIFYVAAQLRDAGW